MSRNLGILGVLETKIRDGERKSASRINVLLLTLIVSLLLTTSQCCEQTCYSAYKDGSLDVQEVQEGSPTIVPINFTGVVTIEAAYIPGYTAQWEYIRFMKDEDLQPLVMQFYTPQKGYITTLSIFAEDDAGPNSGTRYSAYSLFNRRNDDIIIQVSDVHVAEDDFYRIYLGEPGKAHSSNYSYQNAHSNNWEELSFMRFNTTTKIKTDNKAIYFKSISVCSEDTPQLCGDSVETVAVARGEAFNLSCSVYGAPYLEAVWSHEGHARRRPILSTNGFVKTSTISVGGFNRNHMGIWECFWRNKNLATSSETKIFYVVELVSKPSNTYFVQHESENQVFKWIIRNTRPRESPDEYKILLECEQGNFDSTLDSKDSYWISILTHFEEYSAVSEHSATLILPESTTSDNITCTLYLEGKAGGNGSLSEKLGVLDTTTLYREGYHCGAGFYGVGEECVECATNFTSEPRSTTCFPIELPEELEVVSIISAEEKKEWESAFSTNINVKIGVIIGIILLMALAISSVTFTIYVARKLDCL